MRSNSSEGDIVIQRGQTTLGSIIAIGCMPRLLHPNGSKAIKTGNNFKKVSHAK